MPCCVNCGKQISEDAKFCPECGVSLAAAQSPNRSHRTQSFAGEILKCPNCGEPLSAFEVTCHACGYELRNIAASVSVQQFADQVARMQAGRETEKTRVPSKNEGTPDLADAASKRVANLINSYPIPNSKEDITEFLILAASNIELDYLTGNIPGGKTDWGSRNLISESWRAKFEQAYQKAEITFGKDPDFQRIQELHSKKEKEIRKAQKRGNRFLKIWLTVCFVLLVFSVGLPMTMTNISDRRLHKEEEKLEAIVAEIQECIAKKDYNVAYFKAQSIYMNEGSTSDRERWDKVREDLIDMIETKSGVSYTSGTSSSGKEAPPTSNSAEGESSSPSMKEVFSGVKDAVGESMSSAKDSVKEAFSGIFE